MLANDTDDRWLFDTGAAISVISEDLFNRMTPKPQLSKINYKVTGANQKPLKILGKTILQVQVLHENEDIAVLVCPQLSHSAILGMDAIKKLRLVMNPITLKFSKIRNAVISAVTTKTYKVPPMCAMPIRIKTQNAQDGSIVVSSVTNPAVDKVFVPEAITTVSDNTAIIMIKNCNTHELTIPAKTAICEVDVLQPEDVTINATEGHQPEDTPAPKPLSASHQNKFLQRIKLNVPEDQKSKYVSLFLKNHDIFSDNKEDLGSANNFEHNIKLKDKLPIYRKQFRIPEAHQHALHKQIDEWVKIGIIEPCWSRYNSPIFIVPKKDGSFRFVLDYRALNENSLDDRYNMKDVGECIGEIGRAGSHIFSTMDLTSGFWQLPLDRASRPLTAFTCPGKGQFQYNVLSMGLKGGPGSFQRMMELTVQNVPNVIVYIDDLLVHTSSHDQHRDILQQVFNRLRNVNLKLNPDKCEFGAVNVQYLGFRLTPKGILPGTDKVQAVREMKPPTSVTEVRQFLGLCNYFRTHVKNFSTIAGPLNFLTSKKAGWRGGPLPPDAKRSFVHLQKALISDPIVAYPRQDRPFHLIVDAATGGQEISGGFGAILGQENDNGKCVVVAYASRSLRDHERNYTPYMAEMNAAAWAIDHFDVYLRGRKFILHTDHKPLETLKATQQKTLNRLQERMTLYDFELRYKKGSEMPADILSRQPLQVSAITYPHDSYAAAALNDTFCQDVSRYLLSQALPDDPLRAKIIKQIGPHLFQEQDVLKIRSSQNDLIILPRSLANAAIDNAHGTLLTGHGGIDKTVARIRQLYYWPSLIVDVQQRLKECLRCQKALKSAPMAENLHPLPLCSAPNQRIHCDLFGPLKTTDNSKAHVLCITDAYTKYSELCVVHNKEAQTIASAIISNWICRFGIPEQIFSDGGKEFANKLLSYICEFLKIAKNKITPAHPQGNAQVEIVNKSIKKYLTTMTENALDWIPLIPTLAFAYNTTCHSTTGFSPAHLMFGFQPKYSTNMSLPQTTNGPIDGLLRHMFLNRQVATKNSLKNTEAYRQRHDEQIKDEKVTPGQFVFLDRRIFLNTNEKLEDKWEGPFVVLKTFTNGTVDILRKGRAIRVNKSRIKRFTAMGDIKSDYIPQLTQDFHEDMTDNNNPVSQTNDYSNTASSNLSNATSHTTPGHQILSPRTPNSNRARRGTTPFSSPVLQPLPRDEDSDAEELPDAEAPFHTADNPSQPEYVPPPHVAKQSKFGPHPMVLRQRKSKPTVSHLRIASLVTTNKSQVVKFNTKLIRQFAEHINNIASLQVLDEFALPKKVRSASIAAQCNRRREYLKSLSPAKRNTLLTGDPLFAFDPITYEYVWTVSRPPLENEERQLFEHLPHVPELPGGTLVPLAPPNIIPNTDTPPDTPPVNTQSSTTPFRDNRPTRHPYTAQSNTYFTPPPITPHFTSPFNSATIATPPITPHFTSPFNSATIATPLPIQHHISPPNIQLSPRHLTPPAQPYTPVVPQPGSQPTSQAIPTPFVRPFTAAPPHPFANHVTQPMFPQQQPQQPLHLQTDFAQPLPIQQHISPPGFHLSPHHLMPSQAPLSFPIQVHLPQRPEAVPVPEPPPTRITHGAMPRHWQFSRDQPNIFSDYNFSQPQHSLLYRPDSPDVPMHSLPYMPSPPPLSPAMSTQSCPDSSQLMRMPSTQSNLTMLSHMSRNTSLTSTASMPSRMYDTSRTPSPPLVDPMPPTSHMPFRQPPGPQFEDLQRRFLPAPLPYRLPSYDQEMQSLSRPPALPPQVEHTDAFNRFRDSRQTVNFDVPPAPRYVDAYGNPFNQWPPATRAQAQQPPTRGTFDGLSLNDPVMALPHARSPPPTYHQLAHNQHPAVAYQPPVVNLPPIQLRSRETIPLPDFSAQHPAFELVPYHPGAPVAPNSFVLQPRPVPNPAQISPSSSGPPSIDTVQINSIDVQPTEPLLSHRSLSWPTPKPLSRWQKLKAFLGDEALLQRQQLRQFKKRTCSSPSYSSLK